VVESHLESELAPRLEPALKPEFAIEPDSALQSEPDLAAEPETLRMPEPVVTQASEPVVTPTPVLDSGVEPSAPVRPKAHVRSIPEAPDASAASSDMLSPGASATVAPARAPQFEMVAPVEMWFGDYRVGVKSGTKTHAQFRKYADVLLGELKGSDERTR
jgi:hypothetical protein